MLYSLPSITSSKTLSGRVIAGCTYVGYAQGRDSLFHCRK
jgi:hypothetical protein